MQLPPVFHHRLEIFITGFGQTGHRVYTVGAPICKGGDHLCQPFNIPCPGGEGFQVGVVVLPVSDLAFQGAVDAPHAGCNDLCGLVPEVILTLDRFQRGLVDIAVGFCQRRHLLCGTPDGVLQLPALGGGDGCSLALPLDRPSQPVHSAPGAIKLGLSGSDRRGICLNSFVEVVDGALGLVHLVPVPCDRAFQLVVFAGKGGAVLESLLGKLVHSGKGGVPLFSGVFQPKLRLGELDVILCSFYQNGAVLVIQGVDVCLIGLCFCILFPGISMRPQGDSAPFDGVGGKVNAICQFRDCPGKQGENVVVLLVFRDIPAGGGLNLLQLVYVEPGDLCCCQCFGSGLLKGVPGVLHGILHIASGRRQLFDRWDTFVGSGSQGGHYSYNSRHRRCDS